MCFSTRRSSEIFSYTSHPAQKLRFYDIPSTTSIPSRELTNPLFKALLKMIFLFPRRDMLVPWRVIPYIHPWKLTWHWKNPIFNRKYIFKWWIFHCHVSFRGGTLNNPFVFFPFASPVHGLDCFHFLRIHQVNGESGNLKEASPRRKFCRRDERRTRSFTEKQKKQRVKRWHVVKKWWYFFQG